MSPVCMGGQLPQELRSVVRITIDAPRGPAPVIQLDEQGGCLDPGVLRNLVRMGQMRPWRMIHVPAHKRDSTWT
jgi:hypothetical protein